MMRGMIVGGALSSTGTYQHQHLQSWSVALTLHHCQHYRQQLNQRLLLMAWPPDSHVGFSDSNSSLEGMALLIFREDLA